MAKLLIYAWIFWYLIPHLTCKYVEIFSWSENRKSVKYIFQCNSFKKNTVFSKYKPNDMYYVLWYFWDLTCIYNIYTTAPGRLRLTVHWKGYDRKPWRPIIIPESPSMFGGYKGPYKGLFFIQVILGIVLLVIRVQKNGRRCQWRQLFFGGQL